MNKTYLKSKRQPTGKTAYDCVFEELEVLQRLNHPNIMWLYEIIDDPHKNELCLVTKYYCGGSLYELVKEKNKKHLDHNTQCKFENHSSDMKTVGLNDFTARLYFIDMLKALYYCHNIV